MTDRALRLVRNASAADAFVPPPNELLAEWGDWMRAGSAADLTIKTRLTGIRTLCRHAGTDDPVSLTTRQIIRWLSDCDARWTRHTYSTSARAWHGWLVARGYRDDDPTAALPKTTAPKGVPRPASSEALDAVLPVAGRRARAYILLAAYEGLRVHEIAKVRGEDFDGDGWLYVDGKGSVEAALPVHRLVEQVRRGWPETGYWFPGSTDGHVGGSAVGCTIAATFRRNGYDFTAHQLRHWYGTQLQRAPGADIRTTQELMRHASLQSTQIYTEVSSSSKVAAVRRLGHRTTATRGGEPND